MSSRRQSEESLSQSRWPHDNPEFKRNSAAAGIFYSDAGENVLAWPACLLVRIFWKRVIDEIQLRPDLFPILRILADRPDRSDTKFLILGSASRDLIR